MDKENIEWIDLITENFEYFHIDRQNIIEVELSTQKVTLTEPMELEGIEYDMVKDCLIVVDNIKNIESSEGTDFLQNKELIQIRIKSLNQEIKTYFIIGTKNGRTHLVAKNDKEQVFITIQDPREGVYYG